MAEKKDNGAKLMDKAPDQKTMKELTRSVAPSFKSLAYKPESLADAEKFCRIICATNIVPQAYQGKYESALAAVYMGFELGLPPMAALRGIAVINGKPSIYGDLALAVAQSSPGYEWHKETLDEKTGTAMCIVKRKHNPEPFISTFSIEDAKKAGLWGKTGPWTNYPKRMLAMRARGFALRNAFSDALHGMHLAEEFEGVVLDADVVKTTHPESMKLEDVLNGKVSCGEEPKLENKAPIDPIPEEETAEPAELETEPIEEEAAAVPQDTSMVITIKAVTRKELTFYVTDSHGNKYPTSLEATAKLAKELVGKQAKIALKGGFIVFLAPVVLEQRDLIR